MRGIRDWLAERGVTVIVVSFAPHDRLQQYQQAKHWPFVMLADPTRSVYRSLELRRLPIWRLFNWHSLRAYWRSLREGRKPDKYQGDDIYQSGGDFLLDRAGGVLYAHRSHDPADRPTIAAIQSAVEKLVRAEH